MKISKKNLLYLVNENLKEMAMDFDTPDRPDPGIEDKLQRGDTPLKKIPLPSTGREPNQNFQELLASERYRNVVQNIRRYTHFQGTLRGGDTRTILPLYQMMMEAVQRIIQIEFAHREELEQLAVELVKKEMGIPDGALQFDAKIVGMGEFDMQDFNREGGQQQNPDPVDIEKDLFTQFETFNLEKAKRRLINNIIQGASKRGHYMYHYVEPELQQITGSDILIDLYGVMMSVNDGMYWQFSDEMIQMAGGNENMVAGKENVRRETDPPTVVARGINFPVLVHELIKGTMELFAIHGRPAGEEGFEDVEESEDTLEKEMWDLRLGPAIWDRMRSQFPEKVLEENNAELANYLITAIFRLPAKNFLVLMKEVLGKTDRGKRLLQELLQGIEQMINGVDTEDDVDDFQTELDAITNATPDEEVEEFIGDLDLNDEDAINRYLDKLNREKGQETPQQ